MKLSDKTAGMLQAVKSNAEQQINQIQQQANHEVQIIFLTACHQAGLDPSNHKFNDELTEVVKK